MAGLLHIPMRDMGDLRFCSQYFLVFCIFIGMMLRCGEQFIWNLLEYQIIRSSFGFKNPQVCNYSLEPGINETHATIPIDMVAPPSDGCISLSE